MSKMLPSASAKRQQSSNDSSGEFRVNTALSLLDAFMGAISHLLWFVWKFALVSKLHPSFRWQTDAASVMHCHSCVRAGEREGQGELLISTESLHVSSHTTSPAVP